MVGGTLCIINKRHEIRDLTHSALSPSLCLCALVHTCVRERVCMRHVTPPWLINYALAFLFSLHTFIQFIITMGQQQQNAEIQIAFTLFLLLFKFSCICVSYWQRDTHGTVANGTSRKWNVRCIHSACFHPTLVGSTLPLSLSSLSLPLLLQLVCIVAAASSVLPLAFDSFGNWTCIGYRKFNIHLACNSIDINLPRLGLRFLPPTAL